MKHKTFIATTGMAAIISMVAITGVVSAHSAATQPAPPSTATTGSLAARIAERFHLNQQEVQAVIDESKQKPATAEQKAEKQLDAAVQNGDITAEQKTMILQKYQELQQYIVSIKDKPIAERRKLMEVKKQEVIQWAKDNDLGRYLQEGHHFKIYRAHAQHI